MTLLLLSVIAHAQSACVLGTDVDAGSGYCIDETTYIELGQLRADLAAAQAEVAAKRAEVASFEDWRARQQAATDMTLASLQSVHTSSLDFITERSTAQIADCEARAKRKFFERNGVAIGVITGVITGVVVTGLVLNTYGDILRADARTP